MDVSRCTQRLRKVFQDARVVATQREFGYVGAEHLLEALLTPQGGTAQAILLQWGIDPAMVHRELSKPVHPNLTWGRLPLTPGVKEALERADTIAAAMGGESVGPEHFLMGMLQVEGIRAGDLLRREGMTADWVRGEIVRRSGM